ncbi:MAG TPA: TonB-dependent receptor [Flavitalea sp.]|nr:TonB-dependent receptor [Flavitalea sp.]
MRYRYPLLLCLLLFHCGLAFSQSTGATITGRVISETGEQLPNVSIAILGRQAGSTSNDSGFFKIKVPSNKGFALTFSYAGYQSVQRNFLLNENENEHVTISMQPGSGLLKAVTVTDQRSRHEAGLIVINPKNAINMPSPIGGIESLVKVFVGSNNELTSQYSVRGGNYDENLVYVNDFEVFRPYLVRSGQQEGLSFINPELVRNVQFYNGGFQAKYGDKLSSALDVQYKKPKEFAGSAYISFLEQGISLQGISSTKKFTWLAGFRNRSNRKLLSSQETQGNYVPSSTDLQGLFTWLLNSRNSIELLTNYSVTSFKLVPAFAQLTSSIFTPYFTANLGLDIYFEGRESDGYKTGMTGLSLVQQPHKNLSLKWMVSRFTNREKENYDIAATYLFGERNFNQGSEDFGKITSALGAGMYQTYARNTLKIDVYNFTHKGSIDKGRHFVQWGQSIERQQVDDHMLEWQYQDSAGYNIPYTPGQLALSKSVRSSSNPSWMKLFGYVQDNFSPGVGDLSLQAGIRYNYNTLNNEMLLSPRIGISWVPQHWRRDIVFRGSVGIYNQPPFYRELRRADGSIDETVKAQKSWQASGGFDYNFKWSHRPFRFVSEVYYKNMWDVTPYDIDNVRIRYLEGTTAKAYTAGAEFRLFGELVKDAESWISLGFMRSRENLAGDHYFDYLLDSAGGKPVDSIKIDGGWFRRPTDRMFNFGMFLQDYLSTNKNFKVYLNFLYGSNMPYNLPESVKYRNGLIIDPYMRVDIGFSALLLDAEKSKRRSHHPLHEFENVWLTLEVYNLIDRDNTISYQLIRDYANNTFAMPNRLTPRLLNLKLVARF